MEASKAKIIFKVEINFDVGLKNKGCAEYFIKTDIAEKAVLCAGEKLLKKYNTLNIDTLSISSITADKYLDLSLVEEV